MRFVPTTDILKPMEQVDQAVSSANLPDRVNAIVAQTAVFDIHTHLYDPAFGALLLHGIDELLTYHYLTAEMFRHTDLSYGAFWKLPRSEQSDHIWRRLFVDHSPVSEACRGVLTTLNLLGLDTGKRELPAIRKWYAEQPTEALVDRCLNLARVEHLCMTNSPFDLEERRVWTKGFHRDERFVGSLRIDPLILEWPQAGNHLSEDGYQVGDVLDETTIRNIRRFLEDWSDRINARYLMVSLPPDFAYPDQAASTKLLDRAVIPHCQENDLPLALMIGVKRAVNPALRLAGDGMGRADLNALENLCASHPQAKFLCTALSKENQHELCVLARKFPNLHPFGCWWFTNTPSTVKEITRMRLELIGLSVTPQHSDARILEQLIYKWTHFREVLTGILSEKYADLARTGWVVTDAEIQRDTTELLGAAFEHFCDTPGPCVLPAA